MSDEFWTTTAASSLTDDWATPQALFDEWDKRYGFTLDVCAAASNHKCDKWFDLAIDGLSQDWGREICWMNPPYQRGITIQWLRKAYEASLLGATVVALIPARTDTAWFQDYAMKGDITFIRGRVKFGGGTKYAKNAAPFPSCVVVFAPRLDFFERQRDVYRLISRSVHRVIEKLR